MVTLDDLQMGNILAVEQNCIFDKRTASKISIDYDLKVVFCTFLRYTSI